MERISLSLHLTILHSLFPFGDTTAPIGNSLTGAVVIVRPHATGASFIKGRDPRPIPS